MVTNNTYTTEPKPEDIERLMANPNEYQLFDKVYGDVFTTDRYELGNAITNLANSDDVTDDRARFLQELGGTVMFWNTPNYARN